MSTTKYWYVPSGYTGTDTYSGTVDSNVSITGSSLTIPGGASLSDYTFPGGGTLSSTTGNISVEGYWRTTWALDTTSPNTRKVITFQSNTNLGGNTIQTVQDAYGEPYNRVIALDTPEYYTSSNTVMTVRGSGTTEGATNTLSNSLVATNFYSWYVYSGSDPSPSVDMDATHEFIYTYTKAYESDLHTIDGTNGDLAPDITVSADLTCTATVIKSGSGVLDIDFACTATAKNEVGFYYYPIGGGVYRRDQGDLYFEEGTGATLEYFDTDYIATGYAQNQDGYVESGYMDEGALTTYLTPDTPLEQQYSVETATDLTTGILQQISSQIAADLALTAGAGVIIDVLVDQLEQDFLLPTVLANKNPLGSSSLVIDTLTADTTAQNAISAQGQITQPTDILADADMYRGGTATFDATANIPLAQAGFRITAGVITNSEAELRMEPFIGSAAGLILSAGSTLEQTTEATGLGGLQLEAEALLDIAVELQDSATGRIILLPPIGVYIEDDYVDTDYFKLQGDGTPIPITSSLTADALKIISLASELDTDLQLTAQPGFLLSADVNIVQEITTSLTTTGRIFYVDEYYVQKIKPETRITKVSDENSVLSVKSETRINTTLEETTGLVVKPETRQAEQAILPTTLLGTRLQRIPQ